MSEHMTVKARGRREHPCPLPKPRKSHVGLTYLCECGRLYVTREAWGGDCMSAATVATWQRVQGRRWWRR